MNRVKTLPAMIFLVLLLFGQVPAATESENAVQQALASWKVMRMTPQQFRESGLAPVKCATTVLSVLEAHRNELPISVAAGLDEYRLGKVFADSVHTFAFPPLDSHFILYYTRKGPDSVPDSDAWTLTAPGWLRGADNIPDYVEFIANALDSARKFETIGLGYSFNGARIYVNIFDLGAVYGYALPGTDTLEFDNNLDFFDPRIVDIRDRYNVTAAHEFFHRIQFGYTENINFFSEPSAVWMEDKMFPAVNDYLQYINQPGNIFQLPDTRMDEYATGNYDRVVWPKFLDERYSTAVIRRAWENYGAGESITDQVFGEALQSIDPQITFAKAFSEFGRWMFYTGPRSAYRSTFIDADLWQSVRVDTLDYADFMSAAWYSPEAHSLKYQVLLNRQGHDLGFFQDQADPPMAVNVAVLNPLSRTLLLDTLFLAGTYFEHVAAWPNPAPHPEYLNLFNTAPLSKMIRFLANDSLYLAYPGEIRTNTFNAGYVARLTVLDTLRFSLKDSVGKPDSAGQAGLSSLAQAGVVVFRENDLVSLFRDNFHLSGVRDVYRAAVDSVIEAMTVSGKANLTFEFTESPSSLFMTAVYAVDSLAKTSLRLPLSSPPRRYALNYNASGSAFTQKTPGRKVVYFCVAGQSDLAVGKPFPNPAGPGADEVRIIYEAGSGPAQCTIYTLSGKQVRALSANSSLENTAAPSSNSVYNPQRMFIWNLKNSAGGRVRPGIYLYNLQPYSGAIAEQGKIACTGEAK